MSRSGDFDHLCSTEVRLEQPSPSPSATFVLDDKLSEEYQTMTQEEFDEGLGHPFAALKFSCHNLFDPTQQGFIRLYCQIPIDGTISRPPQVRAQQALTEHTHEEVKALISLDRKNCTAVPKLLGYGNRVQGVGDYVPGGYINYVAWMRVAGEPISSVSYWECDLAYRVEVRSAFRATYRELKKDVWAPGLSSLKNLIYDEATKSMHISGFRDPDTLEPEPFSDVTYAIWRLVKPARRLDWMHDSSDWKCDSTWQSFNDAAFTCPSGASARYWVHNGVLVWQPHYFGDWDNLRLYPNSGSYHGADLAMVFGTGEQVGGIPNSDRENEFARYMASACVALQVILKSA